RRVGNQYHRRSERHNPADPRSECRSQLHVVDTWNMSARIVLHRADINYCFAATTARLNITRLKWYKPRNVAEDARPTLVERAHLEKVRGIARHTREKSIGERVCPSEPQERIAPSLGTNSGDALGAS